MDGLNMRLITRRFRHIFRPIWRLILSSIMSSTPCWSVSAISIVARNLGAKNVHCQNGYRRMASALRPRKNRKTFFEQRGLRAKHTYVVFCVILPARAGSLYFQRTRHIHSGRSCKRNMAGNSGSTWGERSPIVLPAIRKGIS